MQAADSVRRCPVCNRLTAAALCGVCADPGRDRSRVCIVEGPADAAALEQSRAWTGVYFVLHGRVDPLRETGPADLGLEKLFERVRLGEVREAVLGLSWTPEGETTAHLLAQALAALQPSLRITRLARGLPSGVELEYTDAPTLAGALRRREGAQQP